MKAVTKIFTIIIAAVLCLTIGVLILNVIAPNVVNQGVGYLEATIKGGTGMSFDIDGNGVVGGSGNKKNAQTEAAEAVDGAGVDGDVGEFGG